MTFKEIKHSALKASIRKLSIESEFINKLSSRYYLLYRLKISFAWTCNWWSCWVLCWQTILLVCPFAFAWFWAWNRIEIDWKAKLILTKMPMSLFLLFDVTIAVKIFWHRKLIWVCSGIVLISVNIKLDSESDFDWFNVSVYCNDHY